MWTQSRARIILSSERVLGNGVRIHVNSKGEIPSTRGSEDGRTCNAAQHRTGSLTHYQLSYTGPPVSNPNTEIAWSLNLNVLGNQVTTTAKPLVTDFCFVLFWLRYIWYRNKHLNDKAFKVQVSMQLSSHFHCPQHTHKIQLNSFILCTEHITVLCSAYNLSVTITASQWVK